MKKIKKNVWQAKAYYFVFVLAMRFFLKSAAAGALPATVTMMMEDALSITSFVHFISLAFCENTKKIRKEPRYF